MKSEWRSRLKQDPVYPLLRSDNLAIRHFAKRDSIDDSEGERAQLWEMEGVERILRRQLSSGAWKYRAGNRRIRSQDDYNQLETYRMLRILIEKYGLDRKHGAISKAAGYFFSHQTKEGDFRGIYGNQYTPNYSAAIMELLIKAGYANDPCVKAGFKWLISIRQLDGGWAIPLRTVGRNFSNNTLGDKLIRPDSSKPFSHLVTGIVLRAFAAHPEYRQSQIAKTAGKLLASRFFKSDRYPDRRAPSFWTEFCYPFWNTDLLSSLDSLSSMEFDPDDPHLAPALRWFTAHQNPSGLWTLPTLLMKNDQDRDFWITLVVCRVFKRLYGRTNGVHQGN